MHSLKGKLLIASPALIDPNFVRSVVLVAEHTADGALGVILNRPTAALIGEAVEELNGVVEPGDPVFAGGPVQTESVMVLAEFDEPEIAAALVIEDVGFLPADSENDDLSAVTRRARVFAGHSGWGPGQLDAEIEEGSWITLEADVNDVFDDEPEDLWAGALRRKGGAYALLARAPVDPSMN
jgi:putative transcriptional regulator